MLDGHFCFWTELHCVCIILESNFSIFTKSKEYISIKERWKSIAKKVETLISQNESSLPLKFIFIFMNEVRLDSSHEVVIFHVAKKKLPTTKKIRMLHAKSQLIKNKHGTLFEFNSRISVWKSTLGRKVNIRIYCQVDSWHKQ